VKSRLRRVPVELSGAPGAETDRETRRSTPALAPATLTGALVMGLLIGVAGCGVSPSHTISSTSAAGQIQAQLASRYPGSHPSVTCPGQVPDRVGTTFVCQATLAGQRVDLDATVTGGGGSFTVTPRAAIVSPAKAAGVLAGEISRQTHAAVTVDCGKAPDLVVAVHGSFDCTATMPGGRPRPVRVTVADIAGNFGFTLG